MLGVERHDGFFPVFGVAETHLRASRFSFAILRPNLQHLHFKELFNRRFHVGLRCQAVDLKRVGVATCRAVHSLFGNQRLDDHLMWLKLDARFLGYVSWHFSMSY